VKGSLLYSLLELGHATSQNLGFAHQTNVHVSYGEETITETNLLELRRRHPTIIKLTTFAKQVEAHNGADWEWHIIGRAWTFRMRVQAKRIQKDGKLKIPHKVKSSGEQQIDLLLEHAKNDGLKPVYCLYSAERQRTFWQKSSVSEGIEAFEAGCLLASAHTVKAKMPKKLSEIENDCVPWHYLVERMRYKERKFFDLFSDDGILQFLVFEGLLSHVSDSEARDVTLDEFPTFDELNSDKPLGREIEGLIETSSEDGTRERPEDVYRRRGISRLIEIDVRNFPPQG
jgi:hypothetical protein